MSSNKAPPGHFRLLFFASAASYTKSDSQDFKAPLPLSKLFDVVEEKFPGIKKVLSSSAVTINLDYVDMEEGGPDGSTEPVTIQAGDEVAIIPPVSSG